MTEPWFDANYYAWIPGTILGMMGGIVGGIGGPLAGQGKAKSLVVGLFIFSLIASAVCLLVGIVAWLGGQPYGVWYGFGLPGLLGLVIFGSLFPVIHVAYRRAEQRRLQAQDL